jgi:hypothetical protein
VAKLDVCVSQLARQLRKDFTISVWAKTVQRQGGDVCEYKRRISRLEVCEVLLASLNKAGAIHEDMTRGKRRQMQQLLDNWEHAYD